MKQLFIINEKSRGANYGIGTYINRLLDTLQNQGISLFVVELFSHTHSLPEYEEKEGVHYLYIPRPFNNQLLESSVKLERFCRGVYYILCLHVIPDAQLIFHFNFTGCNHLCTLLKQKYDCTIVLTVHYMFWADQLRGNVQRLNEIRKNAVTEEEKLVRCMFEQEYEFYNKSADYLIAIANHSYQSLQKIYEVPEEKITLIRNEINYSVILKGNKDQERLRKKYGFHTEQRILIFAGRLDEIKGVYVLLETLKQLCAFDNRYYLIIAGEGDFKECMRYATPYWSHIVFTGFIPQETLFELFTLSDLGIVPSYHEELGYVTLEMMVNGLPVLVHNTSGLSEIISDGVNGFSVCFGSEDKENSNLLKEKIEMIFATENLLQTIKKNQKEMIFSWYNRNMFMQKMKRFYLDIYNTTCK